MSLDAMGRVLSVDRTNLQVRVEAGIRLKDLIAALARHGLALANLGSIASQSLAGAICTGTHGTGLRYRCLADQVLSLKLMTATGEVIEIDRDHPDFNAVVVGLGAFGVVCEMTLSVVPDYNMHAITEMIPFDDLVANLEQHLHAADHFKAWWLVPDDRVVVFRFRRTDAPIDDHRIKRWLKEEVLAETVYRGALTLQRVRRDPLVAWTNKILGAAFGRRDERVCTNPAAFLTPKPPVHREAEWAFPLGEAAALLPLYREQMIHSGYSYNFIQELRFTAADEFWASPAYGRDSVWLSLYNIDRPARWNEQLRQFSSFARDHGGRPHWGKEAEATTAYLYGVFPHLQDMRTRVRHYDPEGKFSNAWLGAIFGEPRRSRDRP